MYNKALDDYIMGTFDPNAPFNQTDWAEQFDAVLQFCPWITDEMLDNDTTYNQLGNMLYGVALPFFGEEYSPTKIYNIIQLNAEEIADRFYEAFYKEFIKLLQ